jgi:hypothetical protein
MIESAPAVLTLKSSGADSSVLTRAFQKLVAAIVGIWTLGTACGCVGGVKSHPLQSGKGWGTTDGEFEKKREGGPPARITAAKTARGVKRLSAFFSDGC